MSLAAVPGRRKATLEVATEIERRGFTGIYCPSLGDALALCEAISHVTKEIRFGTSIQPIYTRHAQDFASTAAFIHEISGGRFDFGIGVSHAPAMGRLGIKQGKPLADIRDFVKRLREVPRVGDLPRIVLATLRTKMIELAEEVGGGMVFANGARSHMKDSLSVLTPESRTNDAFFIGNMIPTCVHDDVEAAKAVNRRTLIAAGQMDRVADCLSDRWLADTTLFGTKTQVRDGIEAWFDAGIKSPIIVPSAVSGGQMKAFEEFFSIW
jgi:alkanesulfonate monooxygenase SsuD/methylene tetrahydromethanopterin reductase-like flavin-dependent oxidoreductase (luciferase family)